MLGAGSADTLGLAGIELRAAALAWVASSETAGAGAAAVGAPTADDCEEAAGETSATGSRWAATGPTACAGAAAGTATAGA